MDELRPDDGPYVGPRPFDGSERARFFGRDQETRALAALVVAHRVVLLYAASGAGKTSLLNAGAIPRLQDEDGFEVLPPVRLRGLATPNGDANPYLANVIDNLTREVGELDGNRDRPPTLAAFLTARPRPLGDDDLPAPRALVFDQFEELFTLYPEHWEQRSAVFDQIRDALEDDPLLRIVLALREDFVAQLDPYASLLPDRLRTRMRLESLRRPAALAAVKGPLAEERRAFGPGTAERLVDDLLKVRIHTLRDESVEVAGEVVEPVQLQVVCRSLWASLPPDVVEIGDQDLERIGSVSDVLSGYYREAVHAAAAAGSVAENVLRDRLEDAFITPVGTRGTVVGGAEKTAGLPNRAIEELEARHLVRAEWRAGARWFELTHDSLIRPIVSSNAAVRRERQAKRERLLKQAVASLVLLAALLGGLLWTTRGNGSSQSSAELGVVEATGPLSGLKPKRAFAASASPILMRPVADGHALIVAGSDGRIRVWDVNAGTEIATLDYGDTGLSSVDLTPGGRELIAAGRLGLRRWTTAGLGTRPPGAVHFSREKDQSSGTSKTPVTAAQLDPLGRTLLLIKGGRASLMDAVDAYGPATRLFDEPVVRVAYSPTGSDVAAVDVDGVARLRRVRSGLDLLSTARRGPTGPARTLDVGAAVASIAFARDGKTLVTASADGVARLWRVRDGTLVRELHARAPLLDAEFSPDGALIATAARDGMVRVWTSDGDRVAVIHANPGPVAAVAFGAGGDLLLTAGVDGIMRVWTTVAPFAPVAGKTCDASEYYAPALGVAGPSAAGNDGERYLTSIVCAAPEGTAVRAPEGGTLARLSSGRLIELTTSRGRVWVLRGVTLKRGLDADTVVSAGATIGSVAAPPRGQEPGLRIDLRQSGRAVARLANIWNPLLFLNVRAAPATVPYPGDRASKAAIARWLGHGAAQGGLPPELPIMASLVETGLRNFGGPNADSAGYFLMRRSIWDNGPYAGFAKKPELQLQWFIEHALAVRAQWVASGRADPLRRPKSWGEWVADVERPPEALRGRYQLRLEESRKVLGPNRPIPRPTPAGIPPPVTDAVRADEETAVPVPEPALPGEPVPAEAAAVPANARPAPAAGKPAVRAGCGSCAEHAVQAALSVLGKPYRWGGASPRTGFDSGGLVQWAYRRVGIDLPRVSNEDAAVGVPVTRAKLRLGDLVLFADADGFIHHIGIYVGGGQFVHAPHTGDVVKVSSLKEPYYAQQFAGGRRVA